MSGYDIKKAVEVSIANFWTESYGQIYPVLKRLTEQGLVEKSDTEPNGKRPRHVYSITEQGRRSLQDWLRIPAEEPPLRLELLLKLFFGSQVDRETNRRQIEAFRQRTLEELERYHSIRAVLDIQQAGHPDLPYWLMTLSFGERDHQAHLEWCDEALQLLEQGASADNNPDSTTERLVPLMTGKEI